MKLFLIYIIISIISISFCWNKISDDIKKILKWYFIFYFFSNFIGAAIIVLNQFISLSEILDSAIYAYIKGEVINIEKLNLYFFLLFSPFIILPLASIKSPIIKPISYMRFNLNFSIFMIGFILMFSFFLYEIIMTGNIGVLTLSAFGDSRLDYNEYILGRNKLFSSMSNQFFGYLYMTFPLFCHISIYKTIENKSKKWLIVSVFIFLIISVVSIGINQKAPLIIFYISIIAGLTITSKVNWKYILISSIGIFLIINIIQLYVIGDSGWNMILSFFHILFRAPASIPYYVNYYPDLIPFTGTDFGILAKFTEVKSATDNIDIHSIMWGQDFLNYGIEGSVSAPFQVRAYAQNGLFFTIINILFVALFIRIISWIYKNKIFGDESISYGFLAQSFIVFYYLSQTNIKDCIWSSYGIVWIFHGIIILLIVSLLYKSFFRDIQFKFK